MTVYIVTSLHGDIMAVYATRAGAVEYQENQLDNGTDTILLVRIVRES